MSGQASGAIVAEGNVLKQQLANPDSIPAECEGLRNDTNISVTGVATVTIATVKLKGALQSVDVKEEGVQSTLDETLCTCLCRKNIQGFGQTNGPFGK